MITPSTALKLLEALRALFVDGHKPPLHLWLGGNPIAVDRFVESTRAAIALAEQELENDR